MADQRQPFVFRWEYPASEQTTITHKARKCEAHVRGDDGKVKRDARGKAVKRTITVPGYTQVVR